MVHDCDRFNNHNIQCLSHYVLWTPIFETLFPTLLQIKGTISLNLGKNLDNSSWIFQECKRAGFEICNSEKNGNLDCNKMDFA